MMNVTHDPQYAVAPSRMGCTEVYIFLARQASSPQMARMIVEEIAFFGDGVQGLKIASDQRSLLLRLERGAEVSLSLSGPSVTRRQKDACALCDGSHCIKGIPDCRVPHVLYLALFGRVAKAGVTKTSRYERRMREQGAQFAGIVGGHPDGLSARQAERELCSVEGLKGGVRFEEKVRSIGEVQTLSEAKEIADSIALPSHVEIHDLRGLYQNPDLYTYPRPLISRGDSIRGRVEDTRGEALFFMYKGNLYAYDLRQALGRTLSFGRARMEAQLTLTNFCEADAQC